MEEKSIRNEKIKNEFSEAFGLLDKDLRVLLAKFAEFLSLLRENKYYRYITVNTALSICALALYIYMLTNYQLFTIFNILDWISLIFSSWKFCLLNLGIMILFLIIGYRSAGIHFKFKYNIYDYIRTRHKISLYQRELKVLLEVFITSDNKEKNQTTIKEYNNLNNRIEVFSKLSINHSYITLLIGITASVIITSISLILANWFYFIVSLIIAIIIFLPNIIPLEESLFPKFTLNHQDRLNKQINKIRISIKNSLDSSKNGGIIS